MLAFQPGCHAPVVKTMTSCVAGVIGDIGNMQELSIVVVAMLMYCSLGFCLSLHSNIAPQNISILWGAAPPRAPLLRNEDLCESLRQNCLKN